MPTNTAGTVAREFHTQQIHYIRKTITFADNGATVTCGVIPSGSIVLSELSGVYVTTVFNGGSTNTCDVGITGSTTKYSSALALGTLGFIEQDVMTTSAATSHLTTADETIIATVISTAGATTGSAEVIMAFIPDNDG